MKKRYIITLIVILILIISANLIQRFYIEPNHKRNYITHKIINPIDGFILYKNNHRGRYFYLTNFDEDSIYNKYTHISEMEAFRKPQIDNYIHRIRSEEHTSELQSRGHLVCRLLLEKKNTNNKPALQ